MEMNPKIDQYSDAELARLAYWAEEQERVADKPELKRAFGAIRQGADWLLRYSAKEKDRKLRTLGETEVVVEHSGRKQ